MADFKGIQEQYDDINQVGSRPVGLMTEFTTEAGRPIYISHSGEIVSEKSTTIPYNGKYVNVPSIHDGIEYSEFELIKLLDEKKIKPTSTHKTQELAVKAAQKRSPSLMSEETARAVESKYWKEMTKRKATVDQILGDSSTELVAPDAKAERRMDDLQAIQDDQFLDLYDEDEKSQKLDAYISTLSEDNKRDIQSYLDKPTPKINSIEGDEAMAKGRARRNDVDETVLAFSNGGDTTTNLGNMEINKSSDGKIVQITSGNMSKEEAEKIKREAEARKGMTQEDKKTASFADLDKDTKSTEEDKSAKSKAVVEKIKTKLRSGEITLDEAKELYMKLSEVGGFADGGLLDEGGSVDPVSGNDVPVGSTQSEVRDDIPAQLSEGEFVLPADVVRYIGLENLMQLRSKAKQGLAQMEAMGQMGNAEEATMEDDGEYDAYIDEMIDSFDPNDPETLKFAEGGMPTYQYQPQQNIYSPTANYNPYTGMTGQPQQFTAGYMPQTTYQAPPVYGGNSGRFTSGQPMGGGTVEQRQYVGPNGEMRTFTFIDGKPTEEIPAGFTVYKPEEKAEPQIVKPEIATVSQDSGGNNGQDQQAKDEYAGYVSEMNQLAQLSDVIGEKWSGSIHNPKNSKGFTDTLGNFIKGGGIVGALKTDYETFQAVQAEAPNIASAYGLDINNYKNTGLSSIFSKYNTDALARDAITSKAVAEALGMDPRDLARTNIDTDGDGRISKEEAKKAEADLFMDEDGVDYSKQDPSAPSGPQGDPYDEQSGPSGPSGPSRGPSGPQGDPYDEPSYDPGTGGGDGPGSDSDSGSGGNTNDGGAGVDSGTPFSKGGLAEQTERALKSSRKK